MRDLHTTGFVYPDEHGVGIVIEIRLESNLPPMRVIMGPERAEEIAKAILELAKDFVSDEDLSRQSPAP